MIIILRHRRCRPSQGSWVSKFRCVLTHSVFLFPFLFFIHIAGGNESGVGGDQKFDRVESTTETRAARCTFSLPRHATCGPEKTALPSCRRVDSNGHERPRGIYRRRRHRKICRIWRDQKPAPEPRSEDRLCQGLILLYPCVDRPHTHSSAILRVTH